MPCYSITSNVRFSLEPNLALAKSGTDLDIDIGPKPGPNLLPSQARPDTLKMIFDVVDIEIYEHESLAFLGPS